MTSTKADDPDWFNGAKVALLCAGSVVTLLRDDKPGLPFANMWDFPGGGREGDETPEQTVLRETEEEISLALPPERLVWKLEARAASAGAPRIWFFGGWITEAETKAMHLGDEGQALRMMPVAEFVERPDAISSLKVRLNLLLQARPDLLDQGVSG
ncbi:MAG: NUDIX hydrolase [Pseudomonadota bacterium]